MQTKVILYQNLWHFSLLSTILFWVRITLKKFTYVLSYVVCTQVRRNIHKQISKKRYGEEKSKRFVFGKPILFTLGLGLTTPYSLDILVWNFHQTFVTVSIEFWLRFDPLIRPTRFIINFLFITAWAERKVRLCETVWFFSWVNTHPLDLNFVAFYSKFSRDSYMEFQYKKIYSRRIFQKFCTNQGYPLLIFVKFEHTFDNFILGPYYVEKIHIRTFIFFCTRVKMNVHKQITKKKNTGKKSQNVLFSKNQFCSLSVWNLLHRTPWVFWYEIFTSHSSLCLLSCCVDLSPKFVPQDS